MLRRLLADALIAAGRRAEDAGRLDAACRRYRAAVALAPGHAPAHLNLGGALEAAGDAASASAVYEALLAREPANPYANYNLGRLRYAAGDPRAADRLLRRALLSRPDFADALIALALAQEAQGELQAAAASLEQALGLRTDSAGAWYNLGQVRFSLDQLDGAEAALRRALELDPASIDAYQLLASVLRASARIAEALETLAAARRLEPARFDLESMELHTLTLSDAITAEQLYARHRAYGNRLEAAVAPGYAPHANPKAPDRRLRVGYVSGDFNRHPVAWFALPLLERHDRAAVEVVCYATGGKRDEVTQRVRDAADLWRDAAALDEAQLADAIHADAIDVLVDLTGHAGVLRLGTFARQPAPVQVSWLGYLHSTGLTRIGFRLSDARADPPGASDRLHTEKLVRLPHSFWCFRPVLDAAAAREAPCLQRGYLTFGSFNHAPKLSPGVRRLWARILAQLPQSRLLLVGIPDGRARADLERDFAQAGIGPERLTILPRVPLPEYLRQFAAVDIALDSWPYGGGTTTFDALWMGVPVLTLTGERSTSRSATSILSALGLEDWIAATGEDYVRGALAHAAEPSRIAGLRAALRARLQASPLMDEAAFARSVEVAYRGMWRAWCARPIA
jgi:predicted O-linked N-acetylglucosamine transferase (SPINDLY family)